LCHVVGSLISYRNSLFLQRNIIPSPWTDLIHALEARSLPHMRLLFSARSSSTALPTCRSSNGPKCSSQPSPPAMSHLLILIQVICGVESCRPTQWK
jgi:hypothetical protein